MNGALRSSPLHCGTDRGTERSFASPGAAVQKEADFIKKLSDGRARLKTSMGEFQMDSFEWTREIQWERASTDTDTGKGSPKWYLNFFSESSQLRFCYQSEEAGGGTFQSTFSSGKFVKFLDGLTIKSITFNINIFPMTKFDGFQSFRILLEFQDVSCLPVFYFPNFSIKNQY